MWEEGGGGYSDRLLFFSMCWLCRLTLNIFPFLAFLLRYVNDMFPRAGTSRTGWHKRSRWRTSSD